MTEYIQSKIDKISSRYDAESDVPGPYNHPQVSYTEIELLNICRAQQELIDDLLRRVSAVEKMLATNATLGRIERVS
jgi:hypothetical protein